MDFVAERSNESGSVERTGVEPKFNRENKGDVYLKPKREETCDR